MKMILVLVFSVLFCLTAVNSLMCKKCEAYKEGKCVEGGGVCKTKYKTSRCADLFSFKNEIFWSMCAKKKTCDQLKKNPKTKGPAPYAICCDEDFCNGESPSALPNETSPESDAARFPENR